MARVVVLGGGLAGCAAAVALGEAGWDVTLVEKRATLGGRAGSYQPPGWDEPLDHCQHILLRCCTHQLDLYQRLGVADQITWHDRLTLVAANGSRGGFRGWDLPAPFHLLPGLVTIPGLGAADRLALAAAFSRLLAAGRSYRRLEDQTFRHWLGRTTTRRLDRTFWRLLLTSVLNADADRIAASAGAMFFLEGLLRHPHGFHLGVPRVALQALHHDAMLAHLARLGVTVRLRTPGAVRLTDGRAGGVLVGDALLAADHVVCAVPWWRLGDAAPDLLGEGGGPRLAASSIAGVHLGFDAPVACDPVVGLLDHGVDWVFRVAGGRRLSLVISDADGWRGLSTAAMVARAVGAVRRLVPDLPRPDRVAACRETRATFVPAPGAATLRPGWRTAIEGLVLAGEWTATGWPSTMEGAVRSGHLAAAALTGHAPTAGDLPRSGAMRALLTE